MSTLGSKWFADKVAHLGTDRAAVMAVVLEAVQDGLMVTWPMEPVECGGVTFTASMDYFAIGCPHDYVRMPLDARTAQRIADILGYVIPTRKMVNAIWKAADVKIPAEAMPMTPSMGFPYGEDMFDVRRLPLHDVMIAEAVKKLGLDVGCLFAGHKKDVVISNRLLEEPRPGKYGRNAVMIYGWHKSNGAVIQGPYVSARHIHHYWDYSHGVRFCGNTVKVGPVDIPIAEVLEHTTNSVALSDEGPLLVLRYPLPEDTEPDTDRSPTSISTGDSEPPDLVESDSRKLPTLRRGAYGPLVARMQRAIRATADSDFGGGTERRLKLFQEAEGLTSDGICGRNTWAVIIEVERDPDAPRDVAPILPPDSDPVAIDLTPIELPDIPFLQARNFTNASRNADTIKWIVIHDMEAAEAPDTAENVAAWFAGPDSPKASAHYQVDGNSIVQSVKCEDVAWHAKKGNRFGIGIEHAGYARQTRVEWLDEYSLAMLKLSAALTASLCKRYDIPVVYVDASGLLRGDKGYTYHGTITKAFRVPGGHGDPGKNFPIEEYLAMVRAHMT